MEQNNQRLPQKPVKSPRKRFWKLWSPLLIKFGISYLVSVLFAAVVMTLYLTAEVGTDPQVIDAFVNNEENMYILRNVLVEKSIEYTTILEGIAAVVTIPILLFMFYRDKLRDKINGILPQKKAPLWQYTAIALMSAALCIGMNNIFLLSNLAEASEGFEQTMEALYNPSLPVQILCLGILIPVCEELVFRGLMYKRMRRQAGFVISMIYTTLVFGLIHMNLVQMIYASCMSIVFCYVYEKYGSVKAPIFAHITANVVSVLATHYNLFEWMLEDVKRVGIITVACAALASTMYVLIARIEEVPEIVENTEAEE